jgi:hypothetical protein
MLIMKPTKENMERLELQIWHLHVGKLATGFELHTGYVYLPAVSANASIESLNASPLRMGDSMVGVALI